MEKQVTKDDFPEIAWRGNWIWVSESDRDDYASAARPEVHALFRNTFDLERIPERAPARLTADSRYALYVNGTEVAHGPIRNQPYHMQYDMLDIAPFLKEGANVFAVYVKYYGTPKSVWMPAMSDSCLGKTGVFVMEAYLDGFGWILSNEDWRAKKSEAWTEIASCGAVTLGLPIEIFDARKLPVDWNQVHFDDGAWEFASVVSAAQIPAAHLQFSGLVPEEMSGLDSGTGYICSHPPCSPYGRMYPRMIPNLAGETKYPHSIKAQTFDEEAPDAGNPVMQAAGSLMLHFEAPLESKSEFPIELHIPEDGYARIIFDMGGIIAGRVRFELEAAEGTVLDICYLDDIRALNPMNPSAMFAGTRYIARGKDDAFHVYDSNGFRYAVAVIHNAQGRVCLCSFSAQEQLCPWGDIGYFLCSDETINKIYQAGIRTVAINDQDAMLDCPTREQRSFPGDSVVPIMIHLANGTDHSMIIRQLTLCNSPRPDGILPLSVGGDVESGIGMLTIPDWSLHYIHSIHEFYRYTGEAELARGLLPTVERILYWYGACQGANGLLQFVPEWNLIDWSYVVTNDTSSLINALWARGLKEFAYLANELGDFGRRDWAQSLYGKVKDGFELFWDSARGSYVDHIAKDVQGKEMSQLAGALAICAGLVPEERLGSIINVITDESALVERSWMIDEEGLINPDQIKEYVTGTSVRDWDIEKQIILSQPFMQYMVHDAVCIAGEANRLPKLYQRWAQTIDKGYDTLREAWRFGSHAHAWSASPCRDVMIYTLGVQPMEPGFKKALIAPRLGELAWAEGNIPTPAGFIRVKADQKSVQIDSPIPFLFKPENAPGIEYASGSHLIRL